MALTWVFISPPWVAVMTEVVHSQQLPLRSSTPSALAPPE